MEGYLKSCLGSSCEISCCERGHGEPLSEFLVSYRGRNQEMLKRLGIKIAIIGDMVFFENCTDGKNCKILKHMGDGGDKRALACKIFPYKHIPILGRKNSFAIYLKCCPATPNFKVPRDFTNQVIKLVKEHYSRLTKELVDVEVFNDIQEA